MYQGRNLSKTLGSYSVFKVFQKISKSGNQERFFEGKRTFKKVLAISFVELALKQSLYGHDFDNK